MKKVKILYLRFKNDLRNNEIELFRGAVLSKMAEAPVLFHNHLGDKFRYAYPLIQYKRLNGKAAIVCLEEGTNAIGQFFSMGDFDFQLGSRLQRMEIQTVKAQQILVQIWDAFFPYRLSRWLPLNEENYQRYLTLDGLVERYAFLEKKLIGNILSFAKGIGLFFDREVVCKIMEVEEPYWIYYKGVRMMAFNIRFKSNVSLPECIGLGKGVSLGNGTVFRV